jgi:hypothetical protein
VDFVNIMQLQIQKNGTDIQNFTKKNEKKNKTIDACRLIYKSDWFFYNKHCDTIDILVTNSLNYYCSSCFNDILTLTPFIMKQAVTENISCYTK